MPAPDEGAPRINRKGSNPAAAALAKAGDAGKQKIGQVREVLVGGSSFSFMNAGAHVIYGLRHWSTAEWAEALYRNQKPRGASKVAPSEQFLVKFLPPLTSSPPTETDEAKGAGVMARLGRDLPPEECQAIITTLLYFILLYYSGVVE